MHACMRMHARAYKCVHLIRMVPADGSCYQEYGCFLLSMGCMVSYSELSASIHACMCISACTSCIRTCKCNFFTMVPADGSCYLSSMGSCGCSCYLWSMGSFRNTDASCYLCVGFVFGQQNYCTLNDLEHTFTPKYRFGAYIDS